jgi:hypothetical protein
MYLRSILAAFALIATGFLAPATAVAAPAHSAGVAHSAFVAKKHACTRTSSGSCIRGGEFCPKAKKGKSGWDAKGRRYVCRGAGSHPHWRKP